MDLQIELSARKTLNFAMEQAGVPVVQGVRVTNRSERRITDAVLELRLDPDLSRPVRRAIPVLHPGEHAELGVVDLQLTAGHLRSVLEAERARLVWRVVEGADEKGTGAEDVEVLAWNEWPGERAPSALLAVFSTPNHPDLVPVLHRVRERLGDATGERGISGYQSRSPARALAQVRALYEAVQTLGLTYVGVPASFEAVGQKVRLPDVLLRDKLGNCLDVSLLFAACLEQMGLHPLLVVVDGHAFPGAWLVDDRYPEGVVDDAARLRTGLQLGHLVFLDSSAAVADPQVTFDVARGMAQRTLADDARFRWALDVRMARIAKYRPLPVRDAPPVAGMLQQAVAPVADVAVVADPDELVLEPVVEGADPALVARLRSWKDKLLDLSLRNKLLAFRRDTKSALPLLVPDVGRFEDRLAADAVLEIVGLPERDRRDERDDRVVAEREDVAAERAGRLADLARDRVHTPLVLSALFARAVQLERDAKTELEESGASTLYAAVGMLRWFEADASEVERLAPLLLVPVALDISRTTQRVRLRRLPEEPVANVTLVEKLRRDFALDLSGILNLEADESGVDVAAVLRAARLGIARMARWEVLDEVALGLFSFTKFLLWKDLEENADVLLAHPVVRHIASQGATRLAEAVPATEAVRLDDTVGPGDVPLVVDADSSQLAAVHSALRGRSFVLQGPPGTGKSQTITNLIAAAAAAGQRVLFVAEKMAALDVVHRRLQQAGLGDFCLELHSHKANKAAVVASLGAALERRSRVPQPPWEARSREVAAATLELNAYVRALHAPRPLGRTFYAASARLLGLRDAASVDLGVRGVLGTTEDQLRALGRTVDQLATAGAQVDPVARHPWRESRISAWSEAGERAARTALDDALAAARTLDAAVLALAESLGIQAPIRPEALQDAVALAGALAGRALPDVDDATYADLRERARAWLEQETAQQARLADVGARWKETLFEKDLKRLGSAFRSWADAFVLFAFLFLFFPRNELTGASRGALPENRRIRADLRTAADIEAARPVLDQERSALAGRLRGVWNGTSSGELASILDAAERLRTSMRRWQAGGGTLTDRARLLADADTAPERRVEAARCARDAGDALTAWRSAVDQVAAVTQLAPMAGTFADVASALAERRQSLPMFRSWAFYRQSAEAAGAAGLGRLVDAHAAGTVAAATLPAVFERSFLEEWVAAVRDAEPALRGFQGAERHRQVARFREQDRAHLTLGASRVVWQLEQRLPSPDAGFSEASEPGIVKREVRKKARHKPIRKLLQEIPNLLPLLKPIWLMSPMSVAQYLSARAPRFDLVIFDEASQIGTHDAIGAIARGERVVIVGDTRQLPPTSFFQRGADAAADDNDIVELESILDEAVASGLPEQMLGWHYRSRHEDLIRFSNEHYYEGRLSVFPAARGRVDDLGITWHPVGNGVYDHGKSRTNRIEADALVAHLVSALLATTPGERTFGVVTFSTAQRTLVADLLDAARAANPGIEVHFTSGTEPVFVKNLENVQGDERDEILFSVAYGADSNGKLHMNFGPLNLQGGERRLNVAVTRARQKLRVFSTLTHHQIDLSRTSAKGARHLKQFLRYAAENGSPVAHDAVSGDFDSDFERQVFDAVRAMGWQVQSQVGCGGYRIDLAVRDSERAGEYLLGIECDGAPYHSAATARDRDRLRQQVLEGLGWRLHRIWSTDWWFDRDREIQRLGEAIEKARTAPRSVAPKPAPVVPVVAPVQVAPLPAVERLAVTPYVTATVPRVSSDPEDLYQPAHAALARRIALDVLAAEAPLREDALARRVGEAFESVNATKRLRKRVIELISGAVVVRGEFAWRADQDPAVWTTIRGAAADGTLREADEIPPEELAAAAAWVLRRDLALAETDLMREMGRPFGITRMGKRVVEALRAGIDVLVVRRSAVREGEQVVLRQP